MSSNSQTTDVPTVTREAKLEAMLRLLIEGFDDGSIDGGSREFHEARLLVEESGRLTFSSWIGRVESELGVDEVDGDSYRAYYDRGFTPADAILQDRIDAGV